MNVVRVSHLVDAYKIVARANHYMVNVLPPLDTTWDELKAAEQQLITEQNEGPQRGQKYLVYERALDQIELEIQRKERGK